MALTILVSAISCDVSKSRGISASKQEDVNKMCDPETGICSPHELTNNEKSMITDTNGTDKPKISYYYDPLCGWCYGFSPVMSQIAKEYGDKIEIEVTSGGLYLGNRVGLINEVAPYIKGGGYKQVEQTTGVKFGQPFLEDLFGNGEMTLSSLPPSIAFAIVKEELPEKELEFAGMLLKAIYSDGMNPINIEEYLPYVEKIGLDKDDFLTKMKDSKYEVLAKQGFQKFQASQLRGMPALVVEAENGQKSLSSGYASFESLKARIDAELIH